MFNQISKTSLSDDTLYEIFKLFIADKLLHNISCVNKEWYNIINKRLIYLHFNKIILTIQEENHKLEIENYLVKQKNNNLNNLYDNLVLTISEFLNNNTN
tara:strand:+ start:400 stop:699 length:300 start_codon:yes stop_codon:yes gene_type:complete